MIVPMKKVSLIVMTGSKHKVLKELRKLGMVHIEISEGCGERLLTLENNNELLQNALFAIGKNKKIQQKVICTEDALKLADEVISLGKEKEKYQSERISLESELDKLKDWGKINPSDIYELAEKGINVSFYEMPKSEYAVLPDDVKTLRLDTNKSTVKFMLYENNPGISSDTIPSMSAYRLNLPNMSTDEMRQRISELKQRDISINEKIASYSCYSDSIKQAMQSTDKEIEFETYLTGMDDENISSSCNQAVSVSHFTGYIEAENVDKLKQKARENSWGIMIEDPGTEDNVPTKLKNNKFVSLVYPLTDFLGTVPGYFEYDISGWFLLFILIFFGIIFGDGGYGLLICAVSAVPIIKSLAKRKPVSSTVLLVGLFGLSTVIWGTLTCTWFGLSPDRLPVWLKALSVPVISNVYADKLWTPPWCATGTGLTTAQNLQIFCFTLALVQLTIAHIKCAVRNRKSVKILGDFGSILQLLGIYYLVLSLVVNAAVFSFGLVLGGIPIGTVAVFLIGIGFVLSFVFSNYEGSVIKSILESLKNIVSVLLGVVNVFSDIVSYIRLWAVGLAGAAISATVNELAGPLIGNFMFMIIAIVLLVFGHGLNMILNILSVIVHGIRLNTLEFSSHLDMSWSGHKFKPFKE